MANPVANGRFVHDGMAARQVGTSGVPDFQGLEFVRLIFPTLGNMLNFLATDMR